MDSKGKMYSVIFLIFMLISTVNDLSGNNVFHH